MEELLAKQDRLEHKAYARGRSDAYAEMGIKALDARLNGETLYVDENDNIIEDMDEETFKVFCEGNEIDISDLTEGDENGGIKYWYVCRWIVRNDDGFIIYCC